MRKVAWHGHDRGKRRAWPLVILCVLVLLTACGGGKKESGGNQQIDWKTGTPPAVANLPQSQPTAAPTKSGQSAASTTVATRPATSPTQSPTKPPSQPQTAVASNAGSDHELTQAELAEYKPNELGKIPVMEYHQIVTDPKLEAQFVRTADHLRQDLDWLDKHNFYVIPLQDMVTDNIKAPAGKHPVVLTFDDSTAGQFRYLKGADGSLTIDPNSAVGVMEDFFAKHPDFGRGATFFTLPNSCFDWPDQADADQQQYCKQKLEWLLAHGYEIGNHTMTHADLLDVDDETFQKEVGGATIALDQLVPNAKVDLFALPNGDYPDKAKHPQQREWMQNGFEYQGQQISFAGIFEVGAEPAPSPAGTDWDPVGIPRIQAFNMAVHNEWGGLDTWFPQMADDPYWLYTSDGNPNTIAFPKSLPGDLAPLDQSRVGDKKVIEY